MKQTLQTFTVIFLGLLMGGLGSYVGFNLLSEKADLYRETSEVVSESSIQASPTAEIDRAIGGMVDSAHAGESGTIISGEENAPYRMFDSGLYEQAVSDKSVIVLYFCSDEDPICQVESPDIAEGFDKLTVSNVVGFQIDYQQETMSAYTKLVLVDGEEVLRSSEAWTTPRFVEAVEKVVNDL